MTLSASASDRLRCAWKTAQRDAVKSCLFRTADSVRRRCSRSRRGKRRRQPDFVISELRGGTICLPTAASRTLWAYQSTLVMKENRQSKQEFCQPTRFSSRAQVDAPCCIQFRFGSTTALIRQARIFTELIRDDLQLDLLFATTHRRVGENATGNVCIRSIEDLLS